MSRYRVTTTSQAVYLIDANSEPEACNKGIALASARIRPQYSLETTADAEFFAEPETVDPIYTRMRKRIAAQEAEAEA